MKYSVLLSFGILALISGCTKLAPKTPVTVADVLANIHNWNQQIITIDGWLGICKGYNCRIFQSLADARAADFSQQENQINADVVDRALSIASDEKFDLAVLQIPFTKIRLKAKVNDECKRKMSVCKDRASNLFVISFKPIPQTEEN
jgi:hypothetical protein